MANTYFTFKQFTIHQDRCAMKVGTDGVLLGAWVNTFQELHILDIGTGTGLIALMLAQRTSATIDAVEIEVSSSIQAKENIALSPWAGRVSVYNSSVQDFSHHHIGEYDLIISNPPFFSNSLKAPNENRNLARHNDELSSSDLLTSVTKMLNEPGRLAVILPYAEASLFIVDAALCGLYCIRKTTVRSSIVKRPVRVLMEFSRVRQRTEESELLIYNSQGNYTEEYKNMTRDFYLN